MKVKDYIYTNSEIENIMDEYIHSRRDRVILKMCFMDGETHERIGEFIGLSPRQVSNIISNGSLVIVEQLEKRGICQK